MQKIPATVRGAVTGRFPAFAEAVGASRRAAAPVATSLDQFDPEDMASVYACLWLAYSDGVDVTFAAPSRPR
jgi:hypothetical protein